MRDLAAVVARDHANTAALLAHIAETDARRLYAPAGYPSMHAFSVAELGLSEERMLAAYLTPRNAEELLTAACGLSRTDLEQLLAPPAGRGRASRRIPTRPGAS